MEDPTLTFLQKVPDSDLINNIKLLNSLASDSIIELSHRHGGLINQVYKKYSNQLLKTGIAPKDLADDKYYVIYNTALSFNTDKNTKYTSWLYNHVKFQCLNALNANNKLVQAQEKVLDYFSQKNTLQNNEINIQSIIKYIDQIEDERAQKILKLRLIDEKKYKWSEIGKAVGLTAQGAINIYKKYIKFIKNKVCKDN